MRVLSVLILTAAVSGCRAQSTTIGKFPEAKSPESSLATLSFKVEKVLSVLTSDGVFSSTFPQVLKRLEGVCARNMRKDRNPYKDGNVECDPTTGIQDLKIAPEEDSNVAQVNFIIRAGYPCGNIVAVLTRRYGKPQNAKTACNATWKIKPGAEGRQRRATLEMDGSNVIYFSMDEDQGP